MEQFKNLAEAHAAFASLSTVVAEQAAKIDALSAKLEEATAPRNTPERDMTKEDARRVLVGDLKDAKHKDAATKLGLSYGQVYSCRGKFTFKDVHKAIADEAAAAKAKEPTNA